MPRTMYSDIEVTAKICMDPDSMYETLKDLQKVTASISKNYPNLAQLIYEMKGVLIRLAEMNCVPPRVAEELLKIKED